MPDIVDRKTRSRMMAGIRGRDTQPELAVRRYFHARGMRFSLLRRKLPGRPDIVLVHGCFWHRHAGCKYAYTPKFESFFGRKSFIKIEFETGASNYNWKKRAGKYSSCGSAKLVI